MGRLDVAIAPRGPSKSRARPKSLSCGAWGVADESGRLLISQDADRVTQIASIAKLVTAIVTVRAAASRSNGLADRVTVSRHAARIKIIGTHAGLEEGDVLSVHDLLYALLLPSGGDAAVALAEYVISVGDGGTNNDDESVMALFESAMAAFVATMNDVAAEIGCVATRFTNPHGIGGCASCVRDVAQIAVAALRHSVIAEACASPSYSARYVHRSPRDARVDVGVCFLLLRRPPRSTRA